MVGKLRELPARDAGRARAGRLPRRHASDVATLAHRSVAARRRTLQPRSGRPFARGLVLRLDGTYRFLHDRVQQAAYSLIPESERAAVHLRIGRLLAGAARRRRQLEEQIFEIVNQLNRGAALIDVAGRARAARRAQSRGRQARQEPRPPTPRRSRYFAAGAALLGEDCWEPPVRAHLRARAPPGGVRVPDRRARGGGARLAELLGPRREHRRPGGRHLLARRPVHDRRSAQRAVDACLAYLRRVGIDWSPHPTKEEVREEYDADVATARQPLDRGAGRPAGDDRPGQRATVDVLMIATAPTWYTDPNLCCLTVARMVNLSLEHGNSDGSSQAYVCSVRCWGRTSATTGRRSASASSASISWRNGAAALQGPRLLCFGDHGQSLDQTRAKRHRAGATRRRGRRADRRPSVSPATRATTSSRSCLRPALRSRTRSGRRGCARVRPQGQVRPGRRHPHHEAQVHPVAPGIDAAVLVIRRRRFTEHDFERRLEETPAWRSPLAGTGSESCRGASSRSTTVPPSKPRRRRRPALDGAVVLRRRPSTISSRGSRTRRRTTPRRSKRGPSTCRRSPGTTGRCSSGPTLPRELRAPRRLDGGRERATAR